MGGCYSADTILNSHKNLDSPCLCGERDFEGVINHTTVHHQIAQKILEFYQEKYPLDSKTLGTYIWTLKFIEKHLKENCVWGLQTCEEFPEGYFPQELLNAWQYDLRCRNSEEKVLNPQLYVNTI
jgi:hypothetical protein